MAPLIAGMVFGGLGLLVLLLSVVFPWALRRAGSERAEPCARAAREALGVPMLSTFLWSALFLPTLPWIRLAVAGGGAVATLLASRALQRSSYR